MAGGGQIKGETVSYGQQWLDGLRKAAVRKRNWTEEGKKKKISVSILYTYIANIVRCLVCVCTLMSKISFAHIEYSENNKGSSGLYSKNLTPGAFVITRH